jgi:hypothetical protein
VTDDGFTTCPHGKEVNGIDVECASCRWEAALKTPPDALDRILASPVFKAWVGPSAQPRRRYHG